VKHREWLGTLWCGTCAGGGDTGFGSGGSLQDWWLLGMAQKAKAEG